MQLYIPSTFVNHQYMSEHNKNIMHDSLVPRPFPPTVLDRLHYVKTEGEGLVNLTM